MKKSILLLTTTLFVVLACSTGTESTVVNGSGGVQAALFKKPISDFQLAQEQFRVQTEQEQKIETLSGTVIRIPADAFETIDGEAVKGEVNLKYKEVKTPAEIILSGITMKYNDGEQEHQFETAGMFDIRAEAAGKELRLKPNKRIDVTMQSERGDDFNFYRLNEEKGTGWELLAEAENAAVKVGANKNNLENNAQEISNLTAQIARLSAEKAPKKYNSSKDNLLDYEVDWSKISALTKYNSLLWRYTKKQNDATTQALVAKEWKQTNLEALAKSENAYLLHLESGNETLVVELEPILVGKDYQLANSSFKSLQLELEDSKRRLELAKQIMKLKNAFSRAFPVQTLGWHNWDKIYKDPNLIWLTADFRMKNGEGLEPKTLIVYVITNGGSVVKQYDNKNFDKMSFAPDADNKMVTFDESGNVGIFSSDDFKKIDIEASKMSRKYTFKLRKSNLDIRTISKPTDLGAIMAKI